MKFGLVERKVYSALIALSNTDGKVTATTTEVAEKMGYKNNGGAISFALKVLELNNKISRLSKNTFIVHV